MYFPFLDLRNRCIDPLRSADAFVRCCLRIPIYCVQHHPRGKNPRSPWGERPFAPILGGDTYQFQSTLPVGGATTILGSLVSGIIISIHAPRGGSDHYRHCQQTGAGDFNPRSPWGERLDLAVDIAHLLIISIHAPRGGSDNEHTYAQKCGGISIHAPRGGSDYSRPFPTLPSQNFNPRSPWGERLFQLHPVGRHIHISIHAPRGGSDPACTLRP